MSQMDYRSDIDGLRAVAVIAVVLFHLTIEQFAGGYIGVDVFFVISGFLITSIIASKHQRGSFTFSSFYLGRVRRIIPPLIATVAVTFIASAIILTPDDFIRFARSAIGALTSTSNILFYLEAGYWDTSSELKPLLHTWSLGVEEQFYLFWPAFVVVALALFGHKRFALFLVIATIVSLIGSLIYSAYDISGAFYLFPARIFQFAAGAAVARLAFSNELNQISLPDWIKDTLFVAGFATIIACALIYDHHTPFPGIAALPPTLGTLAILLAGSFKSGQGLVGRWVLCNPVSIWFGVISYALYLVHWPIVSLYRYETGLDVDTVEQIILAAAMVAAAAILHYGLERRFYLRHPSGEQRKRLAPVPFAIRTGIAALVLSIIAGHAALTGGWAWRTPDLLLTPEQIQAGMRTRFRNLPTSCRIQNYYAGDSRCGQPDMTRVFFLGNSHEPDGFNFIRAGYGEDSNLELVNFGTLNRCPDVARSAGSGWTTTAAECQTRLDVFSNPDFIADLDYLVYSANKPFAGNKDILLAMMRWAREINPELQIITLGGYINTSIPCARILNESGSTAGCASSTFVDYFADTPETEALYQPIMDLTSVFIDRVDLLCGDRLLQNCLTESADGVPAFYDEHHLSLEFAEMAGRMYAVQNPRLFQLDSEDTITADPVAPGAEAADTETLYDFATSGDVIQSTPAVSAEQRNNGWHLERAGLVGESTGGRTGVAHIEFTGNVERSFSGRSLTVEVAGFAETATDIWLQYSTNEVGNSGWRRFSVEPGAFRLSFDYNVAPARNGGGDYLGIAPLSAPILVQQVQVSARAAN